MKKRLFLLLLCSVLLLSLLPKVAPIAQATSGTCGENLQWSYADGVLTISGTGNMREFSSDSAQPWRSYKDSITSVQIADTVTSLSDYAFYWCTALTSVTIPDSVTSIGQRAFSACYALTSVTIGNGVTSIGYSAFDDCAALTRVTIGNSVTTIGSEAFYQCTNLTNVTFPDSLTTIGREAFYECDSLTSVTIPDNVTSIAYCSFSRCSGLTSVTIGSGVTSIDEYAFAGCAGLTSYSVDAANPSYSSDASGLLFNKEQTELIECPRGYTGAYTIPDSVTSIGSSAFYGCSGLTSVTIPDSVTSISDHAFAHCTGLTSVTIPDSVTSIEEYTFDECTGLTSVTIGNGVTSIGRRAFYRCTDLTNVTIGKGVTSIEWEAFYRCSSLTSVTFGDSVTSIGCSAFEACSSLTSVTIPNSVTSIGESAFEACSSLTSVTIPESVTSIDINAFWGCASLTSVTIPDSLTSIDYGTFWGCVSLTSVTIPDSVTSISNTAFYNCNSLTGIWVDAENPSYSSDTSGVLFNKAKTNLLQCPRGYSGDYTIPDSVTSIAKEAFTRCAGLTSVTIPDSVTSIGHYAFHYCTGLTSVTIPDSVTSIGQYAFKGSSSLTSVTIGNSVTSIGQYAFIDCTGMRAVWVDAANSSYSSDANGILFNKDKTNLLYCPDAYTGEYTIPDSVTTIGNYAFSGCDGLMGITLHDGITSIGGGVFYGCDSLTSVPIPVNVTSIGNYTFYSCDRLTSVTLPDGITSIGKYAFNGCGSLTSMTIPVSVKSIGNYAFHSCNSLTDVYYTGREEEWNKISIASDNDALLNATIHFSDIEERYVAYQVEGGNITFDVLTGTITDCDDTVTSANIPAQIDGVAVTSIGYEAFYDHDNLTSVTIPDSVKSIGDEAFSYCSKLTSVTIPNSVTSIGDEAFRSCNSLTSVTIPDSVKSIGDEAFSYCSKLTSVTIPNSVTSIGHSAFDPCSSLTAIWVDAENPAYSSDASGVLFNKEKTELIRCPEGYVGAYTIPESITSIGSSVFRSCNSLTSVTIPDSVTSIGYEAFRECSSMESVTIPGSVTSIDSRAFFGCYNLTSLEIQYGVQSIGDSAFYGADMTNLIIPNSVTTIGCEAFGFCLVLQNVQIPASVTSIGERAFDACIELCGIWVDGNNQYYSSDSYGALFNKEKTELIRFPAYHIGAYTIPDSVTSIADGAATNSLQLTDLIIGESVTTIGRYAFWQSSIKTVTIPKSVTSIGEYAFDLCAPTDVYYGDTEEEWGKIDIDSGNESLTNATIHYTIIDENLNPTMNITAGAEMSVNYSIMASDVSEYEDFYLVVEKEMADGQTVSTTYGVVEEKSTRSTDERQPLTVKYDPTTGEPAMYSATYEGVNAKEMGDSFTTTLYGVAADGTLYRSVVESSSMKEYLLSRFDAETATTELKTMVIDMLKYGAAAQVRLGYNTDNLVTADLTEEQLAYATQEIPEAVNNAASAGEGAAVNTNITVTSRVQLNLSCIYTTATDPNAVKCVITDSEGKVLAEIAATNKGNIMFSAIYENVGAKQMRDVINATFYEGETAISQTVSWSVESYVAQVRAKTNVAEDELNMVNAMLVYGDAVAAYMEAK